MLNIYIADSTFLKEQKVWEKSIQLVSDDRREQILSFHSMEDRCRSLTASLLLRLALGKEAVSYEAAVFSKGEHGKPMLEHANLHFNLSHAGTWAMCALADREVGADIECLFRFDGKKKRMAGIARKCLTMKERAFLEKSDHCEEDLIRIWTKKESFVKMTGEGLSRDLSTVDTMQGICYEQRTLPDGYCATVCTESFCGPGIWQEVKWNEEDQEAVLTCMMS